MMTLISLVNLTCASIAYIFRNLMHMVFCVSQLICCDQVCSKYDFSAHMIHSGPTFIESGRNLTTFRKLYGRHTDLVHKCDASISHTLKGVFTECDIWLVSSFCRSWQVTHVWQEIIIFFQSTSFPSHWGFIIHPFIIYTLHNLLVFGLCLQIIDWFICLD